MYHHKKDSGISLGEESYKESVRPELQRYQFSDYNSPRYEEVPGGPATVDKQQRRVLIWGLHISQLTESERLKLFDGWSDTLPIQPDERKPRILSSYPIPYNFTILTLQHPQMEPQFGERRLNQEPTWHAMYGINSKRNGLKMFFEDYELLHNSGGSPADEESLHYKFPSEHQDNGKSYPCDRFLPTALLYQSQDLKGEEPEHWFKTLDEAWEHRPPLRDDGKL
ncbi:hypothetical protein N431DRAFT_501927 [Stipitochalara longipes BDJ]|nr:hypothetical protein N431DRAFT_501927 [Stipitochalara longipes BDJ]